ncbi:MAG: CoB--CoM heterodisulfide reductase iron-sulfur subunit B family protein [Desulfobacula sp.]|uniref:CoB--CoM heterodisulfide reductase iron-sulfur subunit B family protein n=1 Tax=Desulfobacula sp. TaxID=2593537 RepID=UPI0025C5EE51|nr:CoB--CoM heterodisulfide reductase iron-sulfur subunit B family protein [Desulfobacula sp.]MBC2703327.1 CoB--CoM heterodisulfide reductase iron-sulfur subunit B family protein [Desulfobacula sp.]MCK5350365.1 CoB--CoM heterodisulfide reductase iron-sulfur subunit B family protein [Desulfobacula sp.]
MKYLYYPGCSLEGTSLEYDISTKILLEAVDVQLEEIEDWTCCGATAAESQSHLLSYVLPARNLALAEKMNSERQILVPCSACYLNLKKVEEVIKKDKDLLGKINAVLAEEDLVLKGDVIVKHLLDVLSNDVDIEKIKEISQNKMSGLVIAPYYGCQCLRPFTVFDDPEDPHSMDELIRATGAQPFEWDMGAQCCGASNTSTKPEAGMALVGRILKSAKGADAILTVCPMCQMNLESSQKKISHKEGIDLEIPVLFLPQFLGLAMGKTQNDVRLDLNLSDTGKLIKARV